MQRIPSEDPDIELGEIITVTDPMLSSSMPSSSSFSSAEPLTASAFDDTDTLPSSRRSRCCTGRGCDFSRCGSLTQWAQFWRRYRHWLMMSAFLLVIIIFFAMDNDVLDIVALTLLSSVGFTLCVRALMLARGLRLDGFDLYERDGSGELTLREQMLLHQAMYGDSLWLPRTRPNSTHMRLSMMDREFNPNDYDMLLRLDDEVRANTFTGIPQSQINRLPTFVLKDDGSNGKGKSNESNSNTNTAATLSPKSIAASLSSPSSAPSLSSSTASSSSSLKAGLKTATDSTRKCAVCLEPQIAGQTLRSLPCLHNFHIDCIDPWLRIKPVCPVCHLPVVLPNGRDS